MRPGIGPQRRESLADSYRRKLLEARRGGVVVPLNRPGRPGQLAA